MADKHRKFNQVITTRYGLPEKNIYDQVIDLVKKENLAKSRAQLLLVERGLQHTNNPEPLVKEKVVYKDRVKEVPIEKVVYKDKIVYRDRPKVDKTTSHIQDHITDEKIGEPDTGKRASGDILTTRDKAGSPHTALEEEKSPSSHTRETQIWGGWLPLGIAGIVGLIWWFNRGLPGR